MITDGATCEAWLHGNGRDSWLQAHGLRDYDIGDEPATAAAARRMTEICEDQPTLLIDRGCAARPRATTGPAEPGRRHDHPLASGPV